MGARKTPTPNNISRRPGVKLRAILRKQIVTGQIPAGEFLPSVRQLSEEYAITRKTANRSLKALESEGLVVAEPRRGYRVLQHAADPDRGHPVAYLSPLQGTPETWHKPHHDFLMFFQEAARKRGWSFLAIGTGEQTVQAVMQQLAAARPWGVVLDSVTPELLQHVRKAAFPCVVVDSWYEDEPVDTVLQDNFQGGALAARDLVQRGHTRVAWLGRTTDSVHSVARLGGATMELKGAGIGLPEELCVECNATNLHQKAHSLLARSDRPKAILALWCDVDIALLEVARELRLRPGVDFDVIGWARVGEYEQYYVPAFRNEPVQPAVTWNPQIMADIALDRLETRRRFPDLAPVKASVPVELREPASSPSAQEVPRPMKTVAAKDGGDGIGNGFQQL
jgi:DNA-binding LacI/PurR family transcriptional regulator